MSGLFHSARTYKLGEGDEGFHLKGHRFTSQSLSLNMASVGKSVLSAFASNCKGTGQILCQVPPGYFSFLFVEHLHTKTAKSLSEDEGRGEETETLFCFHFVRVCF